MLLEAVRRSVASLRRTPPDLLWGMYVAGVLTYAVCFQLQQPSQLQLVQDILKQSGGGEGQAEAGVGSAALRAWAAVRSLNGVLQLVGSLISGVLVDRFGARTVLIISLLASAAHYGLTAVAVDAWGLALAQLPTVMQHGVLAARSYVAIRVPEADRAMHL